MSSSSSIVTSEIESCAFGFYSEADIRRLSVKRISQADGLDALGQQVPNGLYDAALGPLDKMAMCVTCELPYEQCPGHFGHIELAVPVYHPLLFNPLLKLLRMKCLYCHHLRFSPKALKQMSMKLDMLENGLLLDAMEIDTVSAGKVARSLEDEDDEDGDEDADMEGNPEEDAAERVSFLKDLRKRAKVHATSAADVRAYRRLTVREFFRWSPSDKCPHCRRISPKIRAEGVAKLLLMPLSSKAISSMAKEGVDAILPNVLGDSQASESLANNDSSKLLLPNESEKHMELLWASHPVIMEQLLAGNQVCNDGGRATLVSSPSYSTYFVRLVMVTASRYRPPAQMGDKVVESAQNTVLRLIINANSLFGTISKRLQRQKNPDAAGEVSKSEAKRRPATTEDLFRAWVDIQNGVTHLMDSTKLRSMHSQNVPGAKQRLEKKQGLFRMNMMGKRVNFSARSVISPDVNLHTREIGVPDVFARQLTYPEPVTAYNVEAMRTAVVNGPFKHPGANYVEDELGRRIDLSRRNLVQRQAIANTLLSTPQYNSENAAARSMATAATCTRRVYRHLRDGDVVLVNRQPTLHRASLMAHKTRVLTGQKTIRMHYANCNTYNADFDGDEINLHFPQSELARAEGYLLANTDNQYLTPKDGSPLRGLIQDHVGGGVLLTKRDTFFRREQFQQLLFAAVVDLDPRISLPVVTPAILKPYPLWTGKQLITCLLKVICGAHKAPLTMDGKSRIPANAWSTVKGAICEESTVVIRGGDLLVGVLDKNQFGASKFGVVHCCYELYGAEVAGDLLTALGRLFTTYLQSQRGFTCGIDDLRLRPEVDSQRRSVINGSRRVGVVATAAFTSSNVDESLDEGQESAQRNKRHSDEETQVRKDLAKRLRQGPEQEALLDSAVKSRLNSITSRIISMSLPIGQEKAFPRNNLSLMTLSGAKGSKVNFSQISCLLGQQELEGRRVPRMCSGRTLPSFEPYSPASRAGGFITDRFLTGIRPQEYYFHCMAGREGLVDTAVKTSRSGYLQRCLVKHLESLTVNYDYTVRDADGAVVMFQYGEDAIDVTKSLPLKKPLFLARNFQAMLDSLNTKAALSVLDPDKGIGYWEAFNEAKENNQPLPDSALSLMRPGGDLGCVSESVQDTIVKFAEEIQKNSSAFSHARADSDEKTISLNAEKFQMGLWLKYMDSLVAPGENVGVLTAQSLGEPSTQMTLNTFHLAGFGGANVTLRIPRLVEIIMTASRHIKTPLMELYLRSPHGQDEAKAERLAHKLRCIRLDEVVQRVQSSERIGKGSDGSKMRLYRVQMDLRDLNSFDLEEDEVKLAIQKQFLPKLNAVITKEPGMKIRQSQVRESVHGDGDGEESEEEDEDDIDEKEEESAPEEDGEEEDDDDEEEKEDEDEEKSNGDEMEVDDEESSDDEEEKRYTSTRSQYIQSLKFGADCRSVEIVVQAPLASRRLLILSVVEQAQKGVLVRATPSITRCYVTSKKQRGEDVFVVQTDGVNFQEIWNHGDDVDVNELRSNDIGAMLDTYGVEAARASIVNEISGVFGVYGISVDYRHLYLLADYMTFHGDYRPLNRLGIDSNASPWQKMTFETSSKFLLDACVYGDPDELVSPSARIILGQTVKSGTGAFDLLQPLSLY